MKKIIIISLSFCFVAVLNFNKISAQDTEDAHLYVVTTFTMDFPEGGSMSELDSLTKIHTEKLIKPNKKIISQKNMIHYYGNDRRDYVVITEYASWGDIEEAGNINDELIENAWTDENDRKAFFRAYRQYFLTHSDEIYRGLPKFDK